MLGSGSGFHRHAHAYRCADDTGDVTRTTNAHGNAYTDSHSAVHGNTERPPHAEPNGYANHGGRCLCS